MPFILCVAGLMLLCIGYGYYTERTVRDQAGAIYRKSGLAGRAELSAYFLEDLLPSQPST